LLDPGNRSMGKKLLNFVIAATLLFLSITAHAKILDPSLIYTNTIGQYASVVHEKKHTPNLEEVVNLYRRGLALASKESYLNFGIGSKPVWLIFEVQNNTVVPIEKRVSIETSWLDVVDIYVLRGGKRINSYRTGDSLPFSSRPIDSRFFSFDHHYQTGTSLVVLRVATPDPLAMPIYFRNIDTSIAREQSLGYVYGFFYGVIVALLVYNLILSASLKNSSYLFYSLYMMTFIATNIAYTGHGYQWFWRDSPEWQMWSAPIFMTSYAIMGFLFATRFLDTKNSLPRFHRVITTSCLLVIIALIISVLLGRILTVLLLAFSVVFLFAFGMAFVGVLASLNRNRSAYYFLVAALLGAGGATITCATVWGILPYNVLSYASVEFGMMFESFILALALASRFNLINKEKDIAENLARLDPLTGLFNRRAFLE
jgi:hypothetical protein